MHRHLAMTNIEEKMPHEERPYRTGITLEILNGISVGMEDIRILQHQLRSLGSTLPQKIIVGIHTSYHILAHPLEHIADSRLLATVEMVVAGRKQDFKIACLILILSQHRPPEEDIIVALDVSHYLAPSLLRSHLVGGLEVEGVDIIG